MIRKEVVNGVLSFVKYVYNNKKELVAKWKLHPQTMLPEEPLAIE